jgi:outer membrane protein TolC
MQIKKTSFAIALSLVLLSSTKPLTAYAQESLTIEQAIQRALDNHPAIKAADFRIEQQTQLRGSALNIPNPELEYEKENNSPFGLGVRQSFSFPTVYGAQARLQRERTRLAEAQKGMTSNGLRQSVRQSFTQAQYLQALVREYQIQDSTYQRFANAAKRQFDAGQIDFLQKTFAEAKASEINNQFKKASIDYQYALENLRVLIGLEYKPEIEKIKRLPALIADTSEVINPSIAYYTQQARVELQNLKLQRNRMLPDLFVGYLKNSPFSTESFSRFRAGLTIPLWFWQYRGNIRSADAGYKAAEQTGLAQKVTINAEFQQSAGAVNSNLQQVEFYETTGLNQARTIITTASRLFTSGQSDYINFIRNLADAYAIRLRYIEALRDYNNAVINYNFLIGR